MKAIVRILKDEYSSLDDFKNSTIWHVIDDAQETEDFNVEPVYSEKQKNIALVIKNDDSTKIYKGMFVNIRQKLEQAGFQQITKSRYMIDDQYSYNRWLQYF